MFQGAAPIRRLKPDIQKAILQPKNAIGLTAYTLGVLERRPGLDSLAALSILFRLKHDTGYSHQLRSIGHSIFCMLIMLAPAFMTNTIRNAFYQIYNQRIFILIDNPIDRWMTTGNYNYAGISHLFMKLFLHLSTHDEVDKAYLYWTPLLVANDLRLSRSSHARLHALIDIPHHSQATQ